MPGTHSQFTPAAGATYKASGAAPTQITLPAYDAGNPAVMMQNLGPGLMFVFAGTGASGSIANAAGVVKLEEGQVQMLPNHAGFGSGTLAVIQSLAGGAQLQFNRGSTTPMWLFPAAVAVVI